MSGITVNPVNANGVGTNTGSTINVLSAVTYNGENNVTGWTWSDGSLYQRSFDSFGRLSSYPLGKATGSGTAAGLLRTLTYDDAGQIIGYTHTRSGVAQPQFDQGFSYDDLGQLQTTTQSTTSYAYSYDANGNRTLRTVGGTSYSQTIAATSNRLTQNQSASGSTSFGYDNAGNMLSDATATYVYSDRGRMSSATLGANTVSYKYNGLAQRVSKTGPTAVVSTGAAYYAYDEAGQLLGEYDANLAPLYETVYLGSTPVAVLKQTGTAATSTLLVTSYNAWADHIDTPRVVTRASDQAIVWRWDTAEPFGATPPDQNPSALGTFAFNQRFPGQLLDIETGNFYNWHRDFKPNLGRYVQSDPIGLAGGVNTYTYVNGNPVDTVDPTGEFGIAGAVWGAGIDLGLQLLMNGGRLKCVNWKDVGFAAAGGALGVGLLNGISKLKKGSNTWNATSKWLRGKNGPGGPYSPQSGQQYHHWAIELNSAVGKMVPDAIKNQPWNLNPIPKATHDLIHGNAPGGAQYGALMRWWQGTPGWATGVEMGLGTAVFAPGDQGDDCECQ